MQNGNAFSWRGKCKKTGKKNQSGVFRDAWILKKRILNFLPGFTVCTHTFSSSHFLVMLFLSDLGL